MCHLVRDGFSRMVGDTHSRESTSVDVRVVQQGLAGSSDVMDDFVRFLKSSRSDTV